MLPLFLKEFLVLVKKEKILAFMVNSEVLVLASIVLLFTVGLHRLASEVAVLCSSGI